jgi:hypothetical protein
VADTRGIDRIYDFVDSVVDSVDKTINRSKHADKATLRREARTAAAEPATPLRQSKFRITEALDSETSERIFIVTDGKVRAECNTRQMAETLLATLAKEGGA